MTALRLATVGSAWFSGEEKLKGTLEPGRYADLAVLSADHLSVPEEDIKSLESVLTVVGGQVVFAAGDFASPGPEPTPVEPAWSPVALFGGYAPSRSAEPQALLLGPSVPTRRP